MKNIFTISFVKLCQLLLPTFLRKKVLVAFLRAFAEPLQDLHGNFLKYRYDNLYMLEITPQVCYLEKCLNDAFDNVLRRIAINDPVRTEQDYIYLESELKPYYLDPEKPIYQLGEITAGGCDFVVCVPASVTNLSRLKALLDLYKLPTKKYEIKTI